MVPSRPVRHVGTILSLAPKNERAAEAVNDPANDHLRSFCPGIDGGVLNIGHVRSGRASSSGTLATLGRNGDVVLRGTSVSRIQCSFEIDPVSGYIVLEDCSSTWTTRVYGENATPFPRDREPRRVAVRPGQNEIIGMCGIDCRLFMFELVWYQGDAATMQRDLRARQHRRLEDNPRMAQTEDIRGTWENPDGHSIADWHVDTSRLAENIQYEDLGWVGRGAFGEVRKAREKYRGRYMAVKVLYLNPEEHSDAIFRRKNQLIQREVAALAKLNHPNIVNYIGMSDFDTDKPKIFMGLKAGSLCDLGSDLANQGSDWAGLRTDVLHHMLQALDHLAKHDILHRDVKPQNILYERLDNGYRFVLGDFGLCNMTMFADTLVLGTEYYMAPELQGGGPMHKVDIWSLFVTYLWMTDLWPFFDHEATMISRHHHNGPPTNREIVALVASLAEHKDLQHIREMAVLDPTLRASAADMLVKLFNGVGLATHSQDAQSTVLNRTAAAPA
ncbi:serine/threonine protein kinase [Purpureocillium lavendulum]|uniref:Serine/threonine protein kinase n=1 Tax=Purpureocillium lavendulum TaxID=1247861 RepID=A0AB34FT55_9HYPO|nr:serine/threonine protein kinase [Purpureocillium lavendulum]